MPHRTIILYCGLLMTLSAFSIDIMLPAFGLIAGDLAVRDEILQLTITVYLIAFACGQLIFGAWSDRIGRRPTLLIGLSIYLAGAALAGITESVETLLVARAIQGIGGASGHVVGRALIRDLYSGQELARNMATAMAVFSIGPIIAPLIGIGLVELAGWRSIFIAMGLFSTGLIIFLVWLPESLAKKNLQATHIRVIWSSISAVCQNRQSAFFTALAAIAMIAMLSLIANAPRLFDNAFGITGRLFAVLFAAHGIGIIVGQVINRILIVKIGTVRTMHTAAIVLLASSGGILMLEITGHLSTISFTALLIVFATSYLIVFSNAASLALDPHPSIAGTVSSFFGFSSQFVGGVAVSILNFPIAGAMVNWAIVQVVITAILVIMLIFWRSANRLNMG